MDSTSEPSRHGYMSRMSKQNKWADRYFVLLGPILYSYNSSTDTEANSAFNLTDTCRVSNIQAEKDKEFVFSIIWLSDNESNGDCSPIVGNSSLDQLESVAKEREKRRLTVRKKNVEDHDKKETWLRDNKVIALTVGGVLIGALTAGIGLIAGMLFLGMGVAEGEIAARGYCSNDGRENREKQIFLSCESFHDAELWVQAIEKQLKALAENDFLFITERINLGFKRHAAPPEVHMKEVEDWISSSTWRAQSVKEGLRLFEQSDDDSPPLSDRSSSGWHNIFNSVSSSYPFLRANISMCCNTHQAFMAIMNLPPSCRTGTVRSIGIVEKIDNHTDVVHIILDRVFVFPTWSGIIL